MQINFRNLYAKAPPLSTLPQALNDKKDIRIVFCDQSKAFDRVWHQGLLYKLESIGITGDLLSWFRSYLHNREQHVIIHGSSLKWGKIPAGVPQGAVFRAFDILNIY